MDMSHGTYHDRRSQPCPTGPSEPCINQPACPATPEKYKVSNLMRQIIEAELDKGTYASRQWADSPQWATRDWLSSHNSSSTKASGSMPALQ
jgi:hypothetical protein